MSEHPNVTTVNRMTEAIVEEDRETLRRRCFTDDFVFHPAWPVRHRRRPPRSGGILGAIAGLRGATGGTQARAAVLASGSAAGRRVGACRARPSGQDTRVGPRRSVNRFAGRRIAEMWMSWGPTPTLPRVFGYGPPTGASTTLEGWVGLATAAALRGARSTGNVAALECRARTRRRRSRPTGIAALHDRHDDESFDAWGRRITLPRGRRHRPPPLRRAADPSARVQGRHRPQQAGGSSGHTGCWRTPISDCVERGSLSTPAGMVPISRDVAARRGTARHDPLAARPKIGEASAASCSVRRDATMPAACSRNPRSTQSKSASSSSRCDRSNPPAAAGDVALERERLGQPRRRSGRARGDVRLPRGSSDAPGPRHRALVVCPVMYAAIASRSRSSTSSPCSASSAANCGTPRPTQWPRCGSPTHPSSGGRTSRRRVNRRTRRQCRGSAPGNPDLGDAGRPRTR